MREKQGGVMVGSKLLRRIQARTWEMAWAAYPQDCNGYWGCGYGWRSIGRYQEHRILKFWNWREPHWQFRARREVSWENGKGNWGDPCGHRHRRLELCGLMLFCGDAAVRGRNVGWHLVLWPLVLLINHCDDKLPLPHFQIPQGNWSIPDWKSQRG